jgi:hypothetical protein
MRRTPHPRRVLGIAGNRRVRCKAVRLPDPRQRDTAVSRRITVDVVARAVLDQGRAAEAEMLFRRALELFEEGGAPEQWQTAVPHKLAKLVPPGTNP